MADREYPPPAASWLDRLLEEEEKDIAAGDMSCLQSSDTLEDNNYF